ncbi:MAG: hypothetical protein ACXWF9_10945 [Solirubrobacterales bacterium]
MPDPIAPLIGRCMCGAASFEVSEPLVGGAYFERLGWRVSDLYG